MVVIIRKGACRRNCRWWHSTLHRWPTGRTVITYSRVTVPTTGNQRRTETRYDEKIINIFLVGIFEFFTFPLIGFA